MPSKRKRSNVPARRPTKWADATIEAFLITFVQLGSLMAAARVHGVPASTASRWLDSKRWQERLAEIQEAHAEAIRRNYQQAAEDNAQGLREAVEAMRDALKPRPVLNADGDLVTTINAESGKPEPLLMPCDGKTAAAVAKAMVSVSYETERSLRGRPMTGDEIGRAIVEERDALRAELVALLEAHPSIAQLIRDALPQHVAAASRARD